MVARHFMQLLIKPIAKLNSTSILALLFCVSLVAGLWIFTKVHQGPLALFVFAFLYTVMICALVFLFWITAKIK